MDLGDILGPEQIIPEMSANNRWEAIDELIKNLVSTNKIKPEHLDAISAVVKKRESSMSTGIGFGIGIPWGYGYPINGACGYTDAWGVFYPAPCYAGYGVGVGVTVGAGYGYGY